MLLADGHDRHAIEEQMPERDATLMRALGIDPASFQSFVEWALSESLVTMMAALVDPDTFTRRDGLRLFRDLLRQRTGREWSVHDLDALYGRVKAEHTQHFRDPIHPEELVKLLWQVPLECAWCQRKPPEVVLHIDHVLPASRGGPSKRANLQLLCAEDNLKKSNKREVAGPWLDLQ